MAADTFSEIIIEYYRTFPRKDAPYNEVFDNVYLLIDVV